MNHRPLADIHGYRGVLYDVLSAVPAIGNGHTIPKRESA